VDITTDAGRAAFRDRILKYADDSVKVLKDNDAQGMIVWDIEGEQYPQATTYIGDPREIKALAPEMDGIADQFFKKFKEAGLRTGVCIRPQQFVLSADGTAAQHDLTDNREIVNTMFDKMVYAYRRWGCTIFYVDSNGDPNVPYPVEIFKNLTDRIAAAGVKALIIPEHQNTHYYAYTAPYRELRLGATGSPDRARFVYPHACSAVYIPDGPVDNDRQALVQNVKRGDILMFRGWWPDDFNAKMKSIYRDAAGTAVADLAK
jgi:hypothetical protein